MKRYRWLLFDADGTLFDYDRAEGAALAAAWDEMGLPAPAALAGTYRRINAGLWKVYETGGISQRKLQVERFVRLVAELGGQADPAVLSRTYLAQLSQQTYLLDGALELLEWARERYELALITNGIPEVQRPRIVLSGFDRFFPVVVISGEEGVAKPAAAIFDVALRRMGGAGREEILLIGDSLSSDVRGGVDYGIDTCWFNPQGLERVDGPEPRYEIRRLDELRGIVAGG